MPTLADVQGFQSSLDDVSSASLAEFLAVWRVLDLGNAAAATGAIREAIAALIEQYGPMSAELGAQWFDDLRVQAGQSVRYEARLSKVVITDALQSRIGWSAYPLFLEQPNAQQALSRFTATLQQEVTEPAKETVEVNVERDPARPRWARHASANACAWCALLATRGPVYRSETSAGGGKKYHPHCHCVPVAVWSNQTFEPAPWVADWDKGYRAARKKLDTKDSAAVPSKAILAEMRTSLGLK
ncbi:VG15 protein [Nakamurella lactea]|uniref:VG15 protein n=1 Tax=Nakamurella lactea TaxID=459515 RepID=UPI000423F7C9|nr:hypothetical protein [Nakamurella lactea]